jgi:glutaredoxin
MSLFRRYSKEEMEKKGRWGITVLILGVLLPLSLAGSAEFYKWKDKDGRTFYSDSPPPAGVDVEIKKFRDDPDEHPKTEHPKTESRKAESPKADSPKAKETTLKPKTIEEGEKRPYRDINVVMYMTTWCRFCRLARDYIRTLDVNLLEYNIERDKDKKAEMLGKSGGSGGVPLIDVEGIIVRGYNPDAIKTAVEKRRASEARK